MEKSKKVYICQQCGKESLKWLGRCPNCQAWNSFLEQTIVESKTRARQIKDTTQLKELSKLDIEATERFPIPISEFNRVLGGGIVPGSLILIGGEPGIGKSTLLLQASALLAKKLGSVAYVTGEETPNQIKIRAKRLGIEGDGLFLFAATDIDSILGNVEELQPAILIIDSIQTVYTQDDDGIPGSITQVRQSAQRLMSWAKSSGVPIFITGHVTKEGSIAGPRVLEHMVDVVLYLEGEQFSAYRLLRCVKNRFGNTNEIGVFEMKEKGLIEVENPSLAFLSQRQNEAVGSAVVPIIEGSRPLLVEIQALTNTTSFGMPRRTANGVDFNRLLMIAAVLTRRLGLRLGNQDIMVNVTGGLKIDEPAADLGIALAIASSFKDAGIAYGLTVVGEIGLSGEIRAVPQLDRRIAEASRLGFKRILTPKAGSKISPLHKDIEILAFNSLNEAVERGLEK